MSLSSYRKRVLASGNNIREATEFETKMSQISYIMDSPSRRDVIINMDELNLIPSIVSDIDTFNYRKFLFCPDMKVFQGDYICHDGFIYLATDQTTDPMFPQLFGRLCNFDFPIEIGEIEEKIGEKPNGEPIIKKKIDYMIKPCVMTTKIYDSLGNAQVVLPEGSMSVYLPFIEGEPLPRQNQVINVEDAQYKVTELSYEEVLLFEGLYRKGYIEVRLQRVLNTNEQI